jgi:hypothetical protein
MVSEVSTQALAEINSANRPAAYIWLVQIAHEDISTIRLAQNTEDVEHDGNTYTATELTVAIPAEREDELPTQKLQVSNVDQTVLLALRTMTHQNTARATVTAFAIRDTNPDQIERGPFEFQLVAMEATRDTAMLELGYQDIMSDNVCGYSFSPTWFPALF